jgi:copper transport protein
VTGGDGRGPVTSTYPGPVPTRSARAVGVAGARAGIAALALGAAVLVAGAAPAAAHATLIGTAPAADGVVDAVPDRVELRFDEPVETVEGAIQVFGPDGDRVDAGSLETAGGGATLRAPIAADAQGTYTVAWRVTSEDSHTLSGSFVFHNGTRTGAVDLADEGGDTATDLAGGTGRWLGYAGTFVAVGAATVALLRPRGTPGGEVTTTRPGSPDGATAPGGRGGPGALAGAGGDTGGPGDSAVAAGASRGANTLTDRIDPAVAVASGGGTATLTDAAVAVEASPQQSGDVVSARLRTLAMAGALVGATGAVVALVVMLAESAGRGVYDAIGLVPDLAPDSRTGQLALARVVLGLAAAAAAAIPALWRRSPVPALALASASLATASLAGHAWTAPDRWVAVAADLVHVGAVAVWVGGLVALLATLPLLHASGRVRLATGFSGLALAAVPVVAVSGTVSGWQQVGSLDALTSTTYGRLLLGKVAGFAVLVTLGWINRSRLVPLVERTVAPLTRSLRVETLVAGVVLALTAALIHQPPARSATSEPFDTTATAESGQVVDATVDATVDPATAGPNDIHLYFFTESGTEPLPVDAVQVTASTTDVPARRLQVTPVSTNHVTVAGASLPSAGTWTVEVTAVHAGEPLVFTFEVPIT